MAAVSLSTKAAGSVLKIKEGTVFTEFVVMQQGYPVENSNNMTLLLRRDCYDQRVFGPNNNFGGSPIDTWLNETYYNLIDPNIQSQIQTVSIPLVAGNLNRKVFLLSGSEVTSAEYGIFGAKPTTEGALLRYFANGGSAIASLNGATACWWLRSKAINTSYATDTFYIKNTGTIEIQNSTVNYSGSLPICSRPAFVLPGTLWVMDDGTVTTNQPPTAPTSITVPVTIEGGNSISITWGNATDPDGNLAGYKLERSINGGAFAQVYQGTSLSCTDSITKGWNTVAYRVRAYDSMSEHSGYTTSPTRTVDNNTAPEIACEMVGNLGVISEGFEIPYTVTDPENDAVTVIEKMDGITKRSYAATLGEENTFDVTGEAFMRLLNGNHTMTVTATDAPGKSSSMTWSFEKAVHSLRITLKEPLATDVLIKKMVLNIVRGIPADAEFQILVTNNANDNKPVWEDATANVLAGFNYLFDNTAVENGHAYNFIITASRKPGGEGGYIGTIGGAFE